jgi:hypothetical protein
MRHHLHLLGCGLLSAAALSLCPAAGQAATRCAAPKHAGISALTAKHVRCATARSVSRRASKKINQRGEGFGSAVRTGHFVCTYRWPTVDRKNRPLRFRVTCSSGDARVAFTRQITRAR